MSLIQCNQSEVGGTNLQDLDVAIRVSWMSHGDMVNKSGYWDDEVRRVVEDPKLRDLAEQLVIHRENQLPRLVSHMGDLSLRAS